MELVVKMSRLTAYGRKAALYLKWYKGPWNDLPVGYMPPCESDCDRWIAWSLYALLNKRAYKTSFLREAGHEGLKDIRESVLADIVILNDDGSELVAHRCFVPQWAISRAERIYSRKALLS